MKFKIHYSGSYEDEIIIEGETLKEVREIALAECNKRGWKERDCWSEQLIH